MNDSNPLFSTVHKRIEGDWNFRVPYIGKWGNRFLDWLWFFLHTPKFTESNIERFDEI